MPLPGSWKQPPKTGDNQTDAGGYHVETPLGEPHFVVLPVDHPLAGGSSIEFVRAPE